MANDSINLISARRAQIDREMAALRQREKVLQAELAELDQAERVLVRLSGQSGLAISAEVLSQDAEAPVGKPEGTPTVTKMITIALREALKLGLDGMEPKQLVEYIAQKWWPNVRTVDVGPIAWRMWKNGQLRKDGTIYMLPENETADA